MQDELPELSTNRIHLHPCRPRCSASEPHSWGLLERLKFEYAFANQIR